MESVEATYPGEWVARCPCHDDKAASLSIKHDAATWKVMLHCFGGCQTSDIVTRLGFKMSDLFDVEPEHQMRSTYQERREASPAERSRWSPVYRALVANLPLNHEEKEVLRVRGIPEEVALKSGYRTITPTLAARALKIVAKEHSQLDDVPGIVFRDGQYRLTVDEGLLCPIYNAGGELVACQVRTGDADRKYVWLSDRRSPRVSASHWDTVRGENILVLAEGPIKASSMAANLPWDATFVGIPGVNQWRNALDEVAAAEEAMGHPYGVVRLAFDMDWTTKPGVKAALANLYRALASSGDEVRRVSVLLWDDKYKGVDDYLAAHGHEGGEAPFEFWIPGGDL